MNVHVTLGEIDLDIDLEEKSFQTVVVGSGASGYNAANRLHKEGQKDIAVVTEHILSGTSRNTGSDKQTYYKLTLSGGEVDSVHEMAETLFQGGCMDGEHALCEASLSVQCFLQLVELGMPFPRNHYGEFIGYKTDHDPRRRATSVGPYTSKQMTEVLEKAVNHKNIPVLDKLQVVRVLTEGNTVVGLLCIKVGLPINAELEERFLVIRCKNVVFATGGPAGMYAHSVFPHGHFGASGLGFEAGVIGKNLTEWQFGLASVRPRWNVSGTYMQVMPQLISTDQEGNDAKEFLFDFFENKTDMLEKVFLKGYQWPFDVRKVAEGSSIIDILVYMEQCKGRRIFLDYRKNPKGEEIDFSKLSPEVLDYLQKADATFGTPLERLQKMNQPAVDFYKQKGVDLSKEPLEIALSAQHNNGGFSVDAWWQTNLSGFFAVGEVAGSHGVYRPGGSALNSGQVGSTRAAQYIAKKCQGEPLGFGTEAEEQIKEMVQFAVEIQKNGDITVKELWDKSALSMSQYCGAIRNLQDVEQYYAEVLEHQENLAESLKLSSRNEIATAFRLREMLISQQVYLGSVIDYVKNGGKSRGSALYSNLSGKKPYSSLPDTFTYELEEKSNQIQEILYKNKELTTSWRNVHPIPVEDDFFENVWREFREHGNIF